jgi:arylsulfatase
MEEMWWVEAGRNQVLPLFEGAPDPRWTQPGEYPRPTRATYTLGGGPIAESRLPAMIGGFSVTARIGVGDDAPAEGVICALGDRHGGWAFYLLDGRPVVTFVVSGRRTRLAATDAVVSGEHKIGVRYDGPRERALALTIDGALVAEGVLPIPPLFVGVSTGAGGMLIGRDRGISVGDDYEPPFAFTGTLHDVVFETAAPDPTPPSSSPPLLARIDEERPREDRVKAASGITACVVRPRR